MGPLAIITGIGALLRLFVLRTQGAGWMDELFSLHFAGLPFMESMRYLAFDVHPPLYAAVLAAWTWIFGAGLLQARLLSVLIGVATIPAMAWMLREAGASVRAQRIAAALIAVSPVLLFHSAEARMYPLLILLVTASTGSFLRLSRSGRGKDMRAWMIASSGMLLTHITAIIPFAVMACYGAARSERMRRPFITGCVLAAAPFIAWLAVSGTARVGSIASEWQFSGARIPSPGGVLASFFAHGAASWAGPFIAATCVGLMAAALFSIRRSSDGVVIARGMSVDDASRIVLAACALAPFLLALPFGTTTVKYHFVALPAVTALVAMGADALLAGVSKRAGHLALIVSLLLIAVPALTLITDTRIRWDSAFGFVEHNERPGDMLYLSWFASELPARAYYRGALTPVSGYPYDPVLSFEERLVRHAGQVRTTPEMILALAKDASYATRVFVVGGGSDLDDPVQRWFAEQGWRLVQVFEGDQWTPTVLLYERVSY